MKKTLIAIAFVLGFTNLAFSQEEFSEKGTIVGRIDNEASLDLQENVHVYIVKSFVDGIFYLLKDERELTTGMDVEYFKTYSPGHKTIAELFTTQSPGHKTVAEITL